MNDPAPDDRLDMLFRQARARRPDTSAAEFAFETRLLARLHTRPDLSSIWALVSWRLIPLFAIGTAALLIWQAQVATETSDAAAFTQLENPDAVDLLNSN